ncbi:AGE family epimerase/isomerase [Roseibium sp. RKSG952]|nr:AGE family epimerase/isomerase [Roseibium sp. RKSG952]
MAAGELHSWLLNDALPVWAEAGRDAETGEFVETVTLEAPRATTAPRRARVQPRQIYVYLESSALGWDGPGHEIARKALDFYLGEYLTADETSISSRDPETGQKNEAFDLYNQAFALFAYGCVARRQPEQGGTFLNKARSLLQHLRATYSHSDGGFQEASPAKAPLRSNPHMHLFEAALELEQSDTSTVWCELADEIADLALTCFIDPLTGGLREFFDLNWSPMPGTSGRIMEPGHQFEWAWLLARWGLLRKRADALMAARRLYQIGEQFGVDPDRQVAIMALNDDMSVHDPIARLWGQTEWIKAAIILARISVGPEQDAYLNDILRSVAALRMYLDGVSAGLWRDKMRPDGSFVEEPAPASSFYHILCAISELHAFAEDLRAS